MGTGDADADGRAADRRVGSLRAAVDAGVAGLGLVVSAPVLLVSAIAIRLTSRGPALFRQARVGLNGELFTVLKLRTMRVTRAPELDAAHREMCTREIEHPDLPAGTSDGLYKLEGDPRITRVGRVLRRLSIDELPQLLNVVRGDMAIVGPRPMLPWEFDLCTDRHRQRSLVKPGLTGLWQVQGRNKLSMGQMLDLDVEYVQTHSWPRDVGIVARTAMVLVRGDGAR
jgi:lipopolysaccharide/colanic/teichoic acid biosynthesis glycosyltransferase